jgi:hypothetical protein
MVNIDDFLSKRMFAQTAPPPEPAPTPQIDLATLFAILQSQVGQPRESGPGMSAIRTNSPERGDVGDMVDYMNYDGDPNMGLLKGLFGGRAQPGRRVVSEELPRWKRGR